jgi:drug/metabolite transporter (DMT)-like permease
MNWLLLVLISIICWGIGNSLLRPLGSSTLYPINPLVLQCLLGLGNVLLILIIMLFINRNNIYNFTIDFSNIAETRSIIIIFFYILINFIALYSYYSAVQLPNAPLSIITAGSSCYPVITMIILCIFYQEYKIISLSYALPGIFCVVLGCILLAFSSNTS